MHYLTSRYAGSLAVLQLPVISWW